MSPKLIAIALMCLAARGQISTPTFEVASIKPATPLGPLGMRSNRNGGPGTADPGRYICENCPVSSVLYEAYDLLDFEYAGPTWVHNMRFDFTAKIPPGATKEMLRIMLQNLLTERFKLAVHREKKEMRVYELTAARNGPKFGESARENAPQESGPAGKLQQDKDGFPVLPTGISAMAITSNRARLRSDNQPMAWLARMLAGQLEGPVIDATGLNGKYNFVVSWAFDENNTGGAAMLDPFRPALIGAIQSQLGLKLEQKKGQAEVLVIDHIERAPTGN